MIRQNQAELAGTNYPGAQKLRQLKEAARKTAQTEIRISPTAQTIRKGVAEGALNGHRVDPEAVVPPRRESVASGDSEIWNERRAQRDYPNQRPK